MVAYMKSVSSARGGGGWTRNRKAKKSSVTFSTSRPHGLLFCRECLWCMLKRMSENESPKKDEEAGGRMTHPASSEKFMGEIARSVETLEKEFDVDLSSLPESLVNEIVLSFQKEEPEHLERIKHFVDSGGDGQSGFYRLLTFFTLPAEFREDLLSVVSRIAPQNLGFVFEKYVGLQLSFSEIKNYLDR